MYSMKDFIQAQLLLLMISVTAAVNAHMPYLFIFSASLLMLLFTMRSLSDKYSLTEIIIQLVLSELFCILGSGFFVFLIFTEIRPAKIKKLRVFFPVIFFIVTAALYGRYTPPAILLQALILLGISGAVIVAEYFVLDYIKMKSRINSALAVTAISELYEKKVNHELMVKNYLADKNARLEERENISRNIHNSVGHSITAAVMALDAADMLFDTKPEAAREKMRAANERMRGSIASIRHAVRVLDDDNPYVSMEDFKGELAAIADNFAMDTMIKVNMIFPTEYTELSLEHEHTEFLTGALQELLVNGAKHGGADVFTVALTADSRHIRLKVSDNGTSDFCRENEAEKIKNGFGLKKLVSYVKRCGGTVKFSYGMGLTVLITLPL